jgi:regulator of RNase E activity RraA
MFAAAIASHARIHLVDFGTPVKIGGLIINGGDRIHADKHGTILIPPESAAEVPRAAEEGERRILDDCKSPEFRVAGLKELTH